MLYEVITQEEWAKFCKEEGIPFDKVVSGELAAMLKDTSDGEYPNLKRLVAMCQGKITKDRYPIEFDLMKQELSDLSAATQKEQKVNPAAQLFEEKSEQGTKGNVQYPHEFKPDVMPADPVPQGQSYNFV